MPDTPGGDDPGARRRLAALFGALADADHDTDQGPGTAQLADGLRQALRYLGEDVGPAAPVGQAEVAGYAVLVTAVPAAGMDGGYNVALMVALPSAAPNALAGAVLSLAVGGRTYVLARLGDAGEAEWAGVPEGPWRFDLVAAAGASRPRAGTGAVAGATLYPLPVERTSLASAAKQQDERRVIRLSEAGVELSMYPAHEGDRGGLRVDLRILKPGAGPIAFPLHYRQYDGAEAVVLVAVENRPYRLRASVALPALDTSAPWSLGGPVGPQDLQEYPSEIVAASLRAVGDNVETADAWRAIAELAGGWLAELVEGGV